MLVDRNAHRTVLLQILKAIYSDATLGPILGFKGGTAALLFYGLDRFSVDLDFDLLDNSKETYVYEQLEKILPEFGVIREKYKKYHTLFFLLSYSEKAHNVKIEISRRQSDARYSLQNYLGISMLVQERDDMVANKLIAMIERKNPAHRDIYDVRFFLKNHWDINKQIVEKRSGLSFKDYLKKAIDYLEKLDNTFILHGLGELLDAKQKAWVKAHLKEETIFLLRVYLDSLSETFKIWTSDNLTFTKVPAHSFSGTDKLITAYSDVKNGRILSVKKQDTDTLVVKVLSDTTGHEADCYIRAKNDKGREELHGIFFGAKEYEGKTYDELLNSDFKV